MGAFYRYANLTTKGNLGFFVPAGADKKLVSNVDGQLYKSFPAGQLVMENLETKELVDPTAGTFSLPRYFRIGVGHNPDGGYLATDIRWMGGADVDRKKTELDVKVEAPGCATPQVIDLEFACTFTGEDYMVQIDIDDWLSRAYFAEGTVGSLIYNLRTEAAGCTNCSEEEECAKLACQLADKINGDYLRYYKGVSNLGVNMGRPTHGIHAVQKFEKSLTYKLTKAANGCDVDQLVSIATPAGTVTFENSLSPATANVTLAEQLPGIIDQINEALKGKGSAYLKAINCCEYEIEINTCIDVADITLTAHAGAITATEEDAFSDFTTDEECIACSTPTQTKMPCGVRIFVNPLELPCHCAYPDGNPPNWYGRKVDIHVWGDGWDSASYRVVEVDKMNVFTGTGYQVQQNELFQSHGGQGRDYPYGVYMEDNHLGLPTKYSAVNQAVTAKCDDSYYIISVVGRNMVAGPRERAVLNSQTVSFINVPAGDQNTIDGLKALFTAMEGADGMLLDEFDYAILP